MENVSIVVRDINGKRRRISLRLCEVCSYINQWYEEFEQDEILMITVDNVCIYSQLASGPITLEDVTGFFA